MEVGLEHAAAEAVNIVGGAVLHDLQQALLGHDVDLQGLQAHAGGGVDGQVVHLAVLVQGDVLAVAGGAAVVGGAHQGDVRAGVQVLLEDLGHGQVDRHVAPGQDHIVLTDVL